jgi:hypothetical protein
MFIKLLIIDYHTDFSSFGFATISYHESYLVVIQEAKAKKELCRRLTDFSLTFELS